MNGLGSLRHAMLGASLLALLSFSGISHAGIHLNVNLGVGSPGYYGVLPIQGVTPQLWNDNPIVAIGAAVAGAPIYLTVPTKHRRNWRKYCDEYDACGVPVYFVRRGWYDQHYGHAAPPPPPPPRGRWGEPRPPKHFDGHRPPPPPGWDDDDHHHHHKHKHHKHDDDD